MDWFGLDANMTRLTLDLMHDDCAAQAGAESCYRDHGCLLAMAAAGQCAVCAFWRLNLVRSVYAACTQYGQCGAVSGHGQRRQEVNSCTRAEETCSRPAANIGRTQWGCILMALSVGLGMTTNGHHSARSCKSIIACCDRMQRVHSILVTARWRAILTRLSMRLLSMCLLLMC